MMTMCNNDKRDLRIFFIFGKPKMLCSVSGALKIKWCDAVGWLTDCLLGYSAHDIKLPI